MPLGSRILASVFFALATAAPARAHDLFGIAAADLGDVDGDGRPDLALSDPAHPGPGDWSGRVWIVSSDGWRVLRAIDGARADASFGTTLAAPGDLDGDGRCDLLVGSTPTIGNARVAAVSSATGERLYELELAAEDSLKECWESAVRGPALESIGDVDGDGRGDFLVGVPMDDASDTDAGLVQCRSGADGCLLFELYGRAAFDRFGLSIARVGDLDGDGVDDAAVGAMPELDVEAPTPALRADRPGYVRLVSSAEGRVLRTIEAPDGARRFGVAVARIDDLDGDGLRDAAVSSCFLDYRPEEENVEADGEPFVALRPSFVRAFSSATGSVLRTWTRGRGDADVATPALEFEEGEIAFGAQVLGLEDLDGDALGELLITAPTSFGHANSVSIYGGSGGLYFEDLAGWAHGGLDWSETHLGVSATRLGDLDGDGLREVAVGACSIRAGDGIRGVLHVLSPASGRELAELDRASLDARERR